MLIYFLAVKGAAQEATFVIVQGVQKMWFRGVLKDSGNFLCYRHKKITKLDLQSIGSSPDLQR